MLRGESLYLQVFRRKNELDLVTVGHGVAITSTHTFTLYESWSGGNQFGSEISGLGRIN